MKAMVSKRWTVLQFRSGMDKVNTNHHTTASNHLRVLGWDPALVERHGTFASSRARALGKF